MNHLDSTIRPDRRRRRPATLLATLLLATLAFGVLAQQAAAVAVINTDVAEEMGNDYTEKFCNQSQDCWAADAGHCQQHGRYKVPCLATAYYQNDAEELWTCKRRIRFSVDKHAWLHHKKWHARMEKLSPWHCSPHHKRPQA